MKQNRVYKRKQKFHTIQSRSECPGKITITVINKMKICIMFAILAAASAAPAPHAIDWEKIEDLVQIIRDGLYTTGIEAVRTIVTTDNPEVGLIISAKLDEIAVNGTILLDNAYAPIQARNVSGRDALELFSTYGLYSTTALDYIFDDVAQLSLEAQWASYDYFYVEDLFERYQYYQIPHYLDEIPFNPVDWVTARDEFLSIASLASQGSEVIKEIIIYANASLTGELFPVVDASEADSFEIIDGAVAKIDNETLSLREAIVAINKYHGVLNRLQAVLFGYEWEQDVVWGFYTIINEGFLGSHGSGLRIWDALTGIEYAKSGKESASFSHSAFAKNMRNLEKF